MMVPMPTHPSTAPFPWIYRGPKFLVYSYEEESKVQGHKQDVSKMTYEWDNDARQIGYGELKSRGKGSLAILGTI